MTTSPIPETVSRRRGRPPTVDYPMLTLIGIGGCRRSQRNHLRAGRVLTVLHENGGAERFRFLLPATGKMRTTVLLAPASFPDDRLLVLADEVEQVRRQLRWSVRELVAALQSVLEIER